MKPWRWALAAILLISALGYLLQGQIRAALLTPTKADLAYGSASDAQKLDLYLPKKGNGPFPVVVFVHGGAFQFGDKREPFAGFVTGIEALHARGIALASINYRMAGEAQFPAAVQDTRSAVRWLRANAAILKIDPARIGIWGKSAGAYMATMTGVTDKVPLFDDPAIAPGVSSRVSAVVAMYGPSDFLQMDTQLRNSACGASSATHDAADSPESKFLGAAIQTITARAAQANPITYARAEASPMLLQAGKEDCTVPHQQSVILDTALRKAGASTRLMLFDGAGHGDDAFETPANQTLVVTFFEQHFDKGSGAR
jgi:acetyl esterase/lipase